MHEAFAQIYFIHLSGFIVHLRPKLSETLPTFHCVFAIPRKATKRSSYCMSYMGKWERLHFTLKVLFGKVIASRTEGGDGFTGKKKKGQLLFKSVYNVNRVARVTVKTFTFLQNKKYMF